jgi:hypothetical protein
MAEVDKLWIVEVALRVDRTPRAYRKARRTQAVINPYSHPVPNVTAERLEQIKRAADKVEGLAPAHRNRVNLALHWFHLALRDRHTDAFIKRWIALEVLAMCHSANIRPIGEALAASYCMTYGAARDKFRVGRLADMGSRIVHDGEPLPIHAALEHDIDTIYFDVFAQVIREPSERRASRFLDEAGADFWGAVIPPVVGEGRAGRRLSAKKPR